MDKIKGLASLRGLLYRKVWVGR